MNCGGLSLSEDDDFPVTGSVTLAEPLKLDGQRRPLGTFSYELRLDDPQCLAQFNDLPITCIDRDFGVGDDLVALADQKKLGVGDDHCLAPC